MPAEQKEEQAGLCCCHHQGGGWERAATELYGNREEKGTAWVRILWCRDSDVECLLIHSAGMASSLGKPQTLGNKKAKKLVKKISSSLQATASWGSCLDTPTSVCSTWALCQSHWVYSFQPKHFWGFMTFFFIEHGCSNTAHFNHSKDHICLQGINVLNTVEFCVCAN